MVYLHKTFKALGSLFLSFLFAHPTFAQPRGIDLQGHRGCRGLMPENTIPAMIEAIRQGVTTLEMDVVVTADRQLVLSHDPYLNAIFCTDPSGKSLLEADQNKFLIFGMRYDALQKWDVGLKFHPQFPNQQKIAVHKPLLGELIDSVEQYVKINGLKPVRYNIETKSSVQGDGVSNPPPEEFVDLLMKVIAHKKVQRRVTIQSFDKRTLQVLHRTHPSIHTSFLIPFSNTQKPAQLMDELGFRPTVLSPDFRLVDAGYLKACHDANMKLVVWTVNDVETIKKMASLGVDGIISDYPNLFKALNSSTR